MLIYVEHYMNIVNLFLEHYIKDIWKHLSMKGIRDI